MVLLRLISMGVVPGLLWLSCMSVSEDGHCHHRSWCVGLILDGWELYLIRFHNHHSPFKCYLLNLIMGLDDISNIAIPFGPNASTCGYCSPPGQRSKIATSYHSASLEAIKLSCGVRFFSSPVLSPIEALHNRFTRAWLTEAGVALVKPPWYQLRS